MTKWKRINDFTTYSVSENGTVRNDKTGNDLKPMLSTSGYLYVHLVRDKKKHTKYLHRLVCQAFLEQQPDHIQVDHINGIKTDNRLSNLRWVTISQNRKAYGNKQRAKARCRKVIASHISGSKITFNSRLDTAKHFNCLPSKIQYGHLYVKNDKKGWIFYKVEDIV